MKKYTLEDWRNGLVAAYNNGTTEELNAFLKAAGCEKEASGDCLYYIYDKEDGDWIGDIENKLPTQNVTDFDLEEWQPKYGEEVMVKKHKEHSFIKRTFLCYMQNGYAVCENDNETVEDYTN